MTDLMLLLQIIFTFMKIDVLSFGGGYAAIPIVEKQIVEINRWMSYAEFADVVAIDELTPGPVAINCATFVGTRMAGTLGAIAATIGCVLPSFIISLIIVRLYYKYHGMPLLDGALSGLKCMGTALITSTTYTITKNALFGMGTVDIVALVSFAAGLFVLRKYKPDPIFVVLGCGVIGLICYGFLLL